MMLYHGISCCIMLHNFISFIYMVLHDVIWCHIMVYHGISCYMMLNSVIPCNDDII